MIESLGRWPSQMQLVLGALLPKGIGFRMVGLFP